MPHSFRGGDRAWVKISKILTESLYGCRQRLACYVTETTLTKNQSKKAHCKSTWQCAFVVSGMGNNRVVVITTGFFGFLRCRCTVVVKRWSTANRQKFRQPRCGHLLCRPSGGGSRHRNGSPYRKRHKRKMPDNHFITTCMDGAAERGYMSASRFIHSSRAVPDTVPVLHPPARRADRLRNGSCRPKRQDRPLPGTR